MTVLLILVGIALLVFILGIIYHLLDITAEIKMLNEDVSVRMTGRKIRRFLTNIKGGYY